MTPDRWYDDYGFVDDDDDRADQAYQDSIAEEHYAEEQTRRQALTPEQRATEDAVRAEEWAKLLAAGELPF